MLGGQRDIRERLMEFVAALLDAVAKMGRSALAGMAVWAIMSGDPKVAGWAVAIAVFVFIYD